MAVNPPHIVVDLGELSDVVAWLDRESQVLAQERRGLLPSVHFGHHTPCGDANAARKALMSALEHFQTNTDRHRHHIAALTAAIEQILTLYTEVDGHSAATVIRLEPGARQARLDAAAAPTGEPPGKRPDR